MLTAGAFERRLDPVRGLHASLLRSQRARIFIPVGLSCLQRTGEASIRRSIFFRRPTSRLRTALIVFEVAYVRRYRQG